MGFLNLLKVASLPILEILIVGTLGAFMATDYLNLLSADTRRSINKIVFLVFTPCLMFSTLAANVTLDDLFSWWFMVANIGLTFLIGGTMGWILVKILRPEPQLSGILIATCSSGNLGNLLLVIIPAICKEKGNPFGSSDTCNSNGLSYVSFSMALGGFFIWTYTYNLIRASAQQYNSIEAQIKNRSSDLEASEQTHLLQQEDEEQEKTPSFRDDESASCAKNMLTFVLQIGKELLAPSTIAASLGLIFGATTFLKNIIVGDDAPLGFILSAIKMLGTGTIPCITLILGGNLLGGLIGEKMKRSVIMGVIVVKYVLVPFIGLWIVLLADKIGFLPSDPLFRFILMIQYCLPPAMAIGTMTQLFGVGQEQCAVIFFWMYLASVIALAIWSVVFLSFL